MALHARTRFVPMGTKSTHIGAILERGGERAAEEDAIDHNSAEQVRKRITGIVSPAGIFETFYRSECGRLRGDPPGGGGGGSRQAFPALTGGAQPASLACVLGSDG